ncbi:MAG TPA: alpha/beta hydrolase-fold protein [Polyangiaceae bacterium]|nr:alpha/beta hydrolase-fold protein [Polyangiaceae bacterium]
MVDAGGGGDSGRSGFGGTAGSPAPGSAGSDAAGAPGISGSGGAGGWLVAGSGGASATAGSDGSAGAGGQPSNGRSISFGTLLDAREVIAAAQKLADSLATPSSSQWQAKGDQHRTYRFSAANEDEPYRLYVPTNWDGKSQLPLIMFLHGSGANENTYVDQNNKQLLTLAQEHGYILVAPLGDSGAYGNFLRLSSPFGKPEEADKLMAQVTTDSERSNQLSEQDVINVLELVKAEYPVDPAAMFLTGHSMGSGGTWYIGGKYASYWKGLAPMSGPFVQASGYPWDSVRPLHLFVTEGTQAPSLEGSRALRDWLMANQFNEEYLEVNADHGGMVRLVLPNVFEFFDRSR